MKKLNQKGFTLVELLVVIVIIGILAVALLPNILGAPGKARDAKVQADVNSIITAIAAADAEGVLDPAAVDGCLAVGDEIMSSGNLLDYMASGEIPTHKGWGAAPDPFGADCGSNYRIEIVNDGIVVSGPVEDVANANTTSQAINGAATRTVALGGDPTQADVEPAFAASYNK